MGKLHRITYEDRQRIQSGLEASKPIAKIAEEIGVNTGTLYNEIRRCPVNQYNALDAQLTLR